jgi:hypothetical protein
MALTRALGFSAGEARLIFDALDLEGRGPGEAGEGGDGH